MQLRFATLILLGLPVLLGGVQAQEELRPRERPLYTPATAKAVNRALRWLATHQNKDGSWSARVGFKINDGYRIDPEQQPDYGLPHLGVTSLAAMAFLPQLEYRLHGRLRVRRRMVGGQGLLDTPAVGRQIHLCSHVPTRNEGSAHGGPCSALGRSTLKQPLHFY